MTTLNTPLASSAGLAASYPLQNGADVTMSIAAALIMAEKSARDLNKINNQIQQTFLVASQAIAVAAYRTQMDAADKSYQAAKTQAAVGIAAGVLGMIGAGAAAGSGLTPISEAGRAVGQVMDGGANLAAGKETLASQQQTAQAEYLKQQIDQCLRQSDSAQGDAKQVLQDVLQYLQNMVNLLGKMSDAIQR
ncbi:hypothetical protein [Paludibacterium sp.]|uniref:hypothetical protein n=1 Tax=Paludibacterium sp. TaxID=1917523 RepID=UPI0025D6152E|nr:hypothetical protein [Paludibacterium sp.]MBV8646144.1 hypothetical protein [Paludibacterium sp.]